MKVDLKKLKITESVLNFDITWLTKPLLKLRSRSFSLGEVIHRKDKITLLTLFIGFYRMGVMQGFSDYLHSYYGKHIRLTITSGYRYLKYNRSIGSSDNSFHIWRKDHNGFLISANDFKSPDLSIKELSDRASEYFRGETYEHKRWKFVHASDYGPDEDWDQW